jgi:NADH:ubiquinone oxidoreductase subunit K
MNFELVIYFSFSLFLLGIFGVFYSRNILSLLITFQLIIISSIINFFSFSQLLYVQAAGDKIFIIFGTAALYLFMFAIIYFIYINQDIMERKKYLEEFKLFKITRSDWWGEDNP